VKTWTLPIGCLGLLSLTALAQQAPPVSADVRHACHADFEKFCPGVRPGGGRVKECMAPHKDELSAACREALFKAAEQHAPAGNAAQNPSGKSP